MQPEVCFTAPRAPSGFVSGITVLVLPLIRNRNCFPSVSWFRWSRVLASQRISKRGACWYACIHLFKIQIRFHETVELNRSGGNWRITRIGDLAARGVHEIIPLNWDMYVFTQKFLLLFLANLSNLEHSYCRFNIFDKSLVSYRICINVHQTM